MPALRVSELETLFTANLDQIEKAEATVRKTGQRIESTPITQKIGADEKGALAGMDRVEQAAKKIVSRATAITVNANIDRAEKGIDRVQTRLDYLRSVESTMDVKADIARAEASLSKLTRQRDALASARAEMVVDVDDNPARQKLKAVADFAEEKGKEGGERGGKSLSGHLDSATRGAGEAVGSALGGDLGAGLEKALVAIPVAGGIILAATAIGKQIVSAVNEGLGVEKRQDRLAALTGLDEQQAARVARAAGEAYANVYGESIEANMDTARIAVQFDLIDANATTRDSQKVIQGLAGISDVLDEDVRPVATAVTTLLKTGMASSAQQAFDIIASGQRNGINRGEDFLDTLTEYPVVLRKLGLDGSEMLGLLNQALNAGARNSDVAADALKEFQIRATDASVSSKAGFERLGFSAEEMTAKIAAGGEGAREGLQQVLDQLRATEDPVVRNAAAVELFGTKAEDLGDALFAMDLSNAVDQLDGVTGSAQRMFDTLSGNDATRIEQAQRNIEVAAQGIQGALAAAFADPLGDFADWVSSNRGPLMQFFADLANGALDLGTSVVIGLADGTEAFGEFVSGPLADFGVSVADILGKLPWPFNQDTTELRAAAEDLRGFKDVTSEAADTMRTQWVGAIDQARDKFNQFIDPQIAQGYLNDATMRVASSIDAVGAAAATGSSLLDNYRTAADGSGSATAELDLQMRNAIDAMRQEQEAAEAAGDSQANLEQRHKDATMALATQLTQMGLTSDQAWALIRTYESIPPTVSTTITADTTMAYDQLMSLQSKLREVTGDHSLRVATGPGGQGGLVVGNASGNLIEFMANGGLPGLTPMAPVAQMVPPDTWRVVGDRGDVPELFTPMDGSPRSWSLLLEGLRRMPGSPPGATAEKGSTRAGASFQFGDIVVAGVGPAEVKALLLDVIRDLMN